MKLIYIPFLLFLFLSTVLTSCGGGKKKLLMPDSTRWTDQDIPLDELPGGSVNTDSLLILEKMKAQFSSSDSLIEGRPVSLYLLRADVSQTAKDFYLLRFIPSTDDATFSLCDSLLTKNDTTRPFYYFLFLRMHRIADGALTESIADFSVKYSLHFVDEFYRRLHLPIYRSSYSDWVTDLASAAPNLRSQTAATPMTPEELKQYIISEQLKNAKKITPSLKHDMQLFADSVASQYKNNY